jgi:hypothetical protein
LLSPRVSSVKLEESRPGVLVATMTAHEISVLLAGARMSLSLMDAESRPGGERARTALEAVLSEFDAAFARLRSGSQRDS